MATVAVRSSKTVASVNGSQANGDSLRVGGRPVSVYITAPAALGRIEVSHDRHNWAAATYNGGTAATSLDDGLYEIDGHPTWIRPSVASDGSAPRSFEYVFSVYKES